MAIPNPPVTPNTSKLHYLLYDATGTNTAAIWHSVKEITVNAEVVGVAHVGTHVAGATLGATDAVVTIAGVDGTTLRVLAVNADGEIGVHDGGNSLTVDGSVTANLGTIAGVATETTLASVLTEIQSITYVEDSVHASGDPGVFVLGVRNDNNLILAGAIGDYSPISLGPTGDVRATVIDMIGAALNDGSLGLGNVLMMGARRNDGGATSFTDANLDASRVAVDEFGRVGVTALGGSIPVTDNSGSLTVDAPVGTPVNVQVGDGTRTATVRDTGTSDSLNVAIVDASGNQITSFGTNVEYTEGATDTSITGIAAMWEDAADTLTPVSATKPLPVAIITGGGSGGTALADDSTFTPTTTLGTPIFGFADETSPTLATEGRAGAVRMTLARGLHMNIRDDAGDSCMDGPNNAVRVNIVAGAGAGGTALADETAYNEGVTSFTPIGGVFNDALVSDPAAGQAAAARITSDRALHVNLRGATGTELGTSGAPVRTDPTGTTAQPASQSGTWNITNVSGTVSLPTGAATSANQSTEITSLQLLDDVVATAAAGALTKLYQVGGTDGTNARILSMNTSGHVNIADGGNSITVDNAGTFAVQATQAGTWNINNVSGTITLPTGAASAANQATEITSLQLLDDVVATDGVAALTKLYQVGGTDGTNAQIFSTDTLGRLNVNVVGGPTGGTSATDEATFTPATTFGTPMMGAADEAATDSVPENTVGIVRMTLDRKLLTRVVGATDTNRLDVDASGRITANLAAGTNNIGDVDVLTVPAPLSTTGNGTAAAALRVTVASDSTGKITVDAGSGAFACNTGILATTLAVAGTALALPASALPNRRRIVIQNTSSTDSLFVGGSAVTASGATKGMEILPGFAQALEAGPGVGVFGITGGTSVNVCTLELS